MDKRHDDFFYTVMINDLQEVEHFLNSGIDINTMDDNGCTALHLACSCGSQKIVNLLISRCATVDIQSTQGNTAFHLACRWGNFQIVRTLLDCNADAKVQNRQGYTGLHFASYYGHSLITKILLEEYDGSNVDTQDIRGYTALHMACLWDNLEVAKMLVKHKSSLSILTIDDETPLDIAKSMERYEIAHYLESYVPLKQETFLPKKNLRNKFTSLFGKR